MISLRLAVPHDLTPAVLEVLDDDSVAQLTVLGGASRRPAGDVVVAEVAREGADSVVEALCRLGVDERGALSLTDLAAAPYRRADAAERVAPGASDDSVLWRVIETSADAESRGSYAFFVFLVLATALAAVAVVTDSSVLVVGAMVVGPEFSTVAGMCIGLARGRLDVAVRSLRLLVAGFALAIAVVAAVSLLGVWGGMITREMVTRPRPQTGFIWHPDPWSFVVALLAGAAGVLSVTAGKANALVGVFISVTTVPAAGNLALALATWAPDEMRGSALQLLVNIAGMVVAGVVTLVVQHLVWRRVGRARPRHTSVRVGSPSR